MGPASCSGHWCCWATVHRPFLQSPSISRWNPLWPDTHPRWRLVNIQLLLLQLRFQSTDWLAGRCHPPRCSRTTLFIVPRIVLEWMGAPESARLLSWDPNTWIWSLTRLQTIDAARQLQHDACLMTSNLNVLVQYVLCLQGTATKLLDLTMGRQFTSAALASAAPVPGVGCAAIHI